MDLTLHTWSTTTDRQRQSPVTKKNKTKNNNYTRLPACSSNRNKKSVAASGWWKRWSQSVELYWLLLIITSWWDWQVLEVCDAPQRDTDTSCRRRLPRCYGAAGRSRQLKAIFNVVTICGRKKKKVPAPAATVLVSLLFNLPTRDVTITGKRMNRGEKSEGLLYRFKF